MNGSKNQNYIVLREGWFEISDRLNLDKPEAPIVIANSWSDEIKETTSTTAEVPKDKEAFIPLKGTDETLSQFVAKNIEYPIEAKNKNLDVLVRFRVYNDGKVDNVNTSYMVGSHLIEKKILKSCIDVIKKTSGKWLTNYVKNKNGSYYELRFRFLKDTVLLVK